MPGETLLRDAAREAVEQCKLSNRQHDRLRGGPGVGAPCRVCDRPVEKDEMEFEVEFARDGGAPHFHGYHVHVRCFAAWELARMDGHAPS